MEQPLHKKIKKTVKFLRFQMKKILYFKEISLEEIYTMLQEYENRNRKNILSDTKEILNDHDPTLVEYFDYVIQQKQLNYPPRDWKEEKVFSKQL